MSVIMNFEIRGDRELTDIVSTEILTVAGKTEKSVVQNTDGNRHCREKAAQ